MEQGRLLIAIALSFLVFFIWNYFYSPTIHTIEKKDEIKQNDSTAATDNPVGNPRISPNETIANTDQNSGIENRTNRTITVHTPLYKMTLDERGAAIVGMILNDYREDAKKESPLKQIMPDTVKGGTLLTTMSGGGYAIAENALYRVDRDADDIYVRNQQETVTFQYRDEKGLQLEKKYTFHKDSYLVDLDINVYNGLQNDMSTSIGVALRQIMDEETEAYGFKGPSALVNGKLQQVAVKNIKENDKIAGKIKWASVETRYFMSSLINNEAIDANLALSYENQVVKNKLTIENGTIAPGQRKNISLTLFMGPKSLSLLKSMKNQLDKAINFGWFEFIAKPCLYFMNWIHRFIPNYGVAIIILTIVTRIIFWPLANKSYKSMNEMRKIQPLMQEVREKYKDDKTKMNQEMMALYRTYKINPVGGCLPMVIQLPVFFALYQMLYQAIELRHAPFIGWINDLSAPDRLFNFGFHIPFMNDPSGIPVLTLLMGATMFFQQKLSPQPGDPTQAKMMMFMPVIFTFIFINFSAGLVLYWLVSNVISIAQQYYTQKKLA